MSILKVNQITPYTGSTLVVSGSTLSIPGGTVSGTSLTGTLTTAAQPNITSLGTLTQLNTDNIRIDGNTISSQDTNGNVLIQPNGTGDVVINESGADVDFRVEGDTDQNLLFVDASTDRIGIGTSSPGASLDVAGSVRAGGNATNPGDVVIQQSDNTEAGSGGLEFKADGANSGYGARIKSVFDGSNAYDLAFQLRNNSTSWSTPMLLDSSGNVGIGTSSPSVPLHVINASLPRIYLGSEATKFGGLIYSAGTTFGSVAIRGQGNDTGTVLHVDRDNSQIRFDTGDNERMRIDSSGNVGIGTSSPSTYGKVVSKGGTFALVTDTAAERRLSFWSTANGNSENAYIQVQNDGATTNTGEILFATKNQGGTLAERMRIDASGNVGIGTDSPSSSFRLTVNGVGTLGNPLGGIVLQQAGTDVFYISNIAGNNNTDIDLWNPRNGFVRIGTNNAERMRIDSSGNVGIGTASAGGKLEVYAGASGATALSNGANFIVQNSSAVGMSLLCPDANASRIYFGTASNNANAFIYSDYNGGSQTLIFGVGTSTTAATEKMRIDSSGNVGIGTTPTKKLHVTGTGQFVSESATLNGSNGITINKGDNTYHNGIFFEGVAVSDLYFGRVAGVSDDLVFKRATGNVEIARIQMNNGGISFNGDTAAANALDDYEEGTYTPTFVNVTLGNATSEFKYVKIGKQLTVSGYIIFGSTTSFGGTIQIGMPLTIDTSVGGTAYLYDDTGVEYLVSAGTYTGSYTRVLFSDGTGGGFVSNTSPFTWAVSDRFAFTVTYFTT